MPSVVLDANIAIFAVLPMPQHETAIRLIEQLVRDEIPIYVPHLWYAEVATGIRKTAAIVGLANEMEALDAALNLPVKRYPEDTSLSREAYRLAQDLQQTAVYDATYLALAQRLQAIFWTADRRFFNRCQTHRLDFVQLLKD
jgi:predicted nucleic acid-binding protein